MAISDNTYKINQLITKINALPNANSGSGSGGVQLPTLTNPGAANDIAYGKELIDANGNVVTGKVPVVDSTTETSQYGFILSDVAQYAKAHKLTDWFFLENTFNVNDKLMLKEGAQVCLTAPMSLFGDAKPEDVAEGKFFTSENGLLVRGTKTGGGGGSLPVGIQKLDSGIYTPTSDIASSVQISHNLGVRPNFYLFAPVGPSSETTPATYLYSQMAVFRYHEGTSKTVYGYGSIVASYSDGNTISYGLVFSDLNNITTSQITVAITNNYKLKAGVTYRWIVGVIDGVE